MGDMNPIFDWYAMDAAKAKARAEGYAAGYEAGQRERTEQAAHYLELMAGKQPCDCIKEIQANYGPFLVQRCTCGNNGDLADAEAWVVLMRCVKGIRTLPINPPPAEAATKDTP